jgi:hypothetical protein
MLNVRHFAEWFPRDFRIFAAAKNFVQIRSHAMQNAFDPVVVWWTDGKRWHAKDGFLTRDWHIANSSAYVANKQAIEKAHPCPCPIDQVRYVVRGWCPPGGVILDSFAGSGTTGVAAIAEGRKCVLIEKEPKYADICRRRVAEAMGLGKGSLLATLPAASLLEGLE